MCKYPLMSMSASEAIASRRSIRAFTDEPVNDELIRTILSDAARAPSGTNIQPWNVIVLQGESRNDLVDVVEAAFDVGDRTSQEEYYPTEFVEPYLARRRKIGWDMYGLLGIERGQHDKMAAQHRKNYEFFGAPVGMFFMLHKTMQSGGWMDLGLYMGNIMTLAREHGLHTCPQAAWQEFGHIVHQHLQLPDDQAMVVGMALGYEDTDAIVNTLTTERAALSEFVEFRS